MRCRSCLLVLGLMAIGLAYLLYSPFPDGAVDLQQQRVMSIFTAALLNMCDFQEYVGYSTLTKCATNPFNLLKVRTAEELSDDDVMVNEELFDGVKVRLYTPRDSRLKRPLPALIFFHGGGFIIGSVDQYDSFTRILATSIPAVVVSVGYRLAPEFTFPIPFQDCLAATKYFMRHADRFGVDANRIALSGDSAGGNLAMAVGTKLTQERQPPRLLGLIYPALQMVDLKTPSYNTYTSSPFLLRSERMVQFYLRHIFGNDDDLHKFLENQHLTKKMRESVKSKVNVDLLPEKYKSQYRAQDLKPVDKSLAERAEKIITNVFAFPLMLEDEMLSKLPKAYLVTCEYDPLRDDGLMLAKRWKDLDFPVKHVHWDGIQHGFFPAYFLNRSREATADFVAYLKKEL
ncbi:arylacetamide deacetylase-like [Argopecten irradians]|uniref:arylacetamide deacetylase-like n=1 Tax=Argopecten irradians TaxID=31199 RepID=UPI00371EF252